MEKSVKWRRGGRGGVGGGRVSDGKEEEKG